MGESGYPGTIRKFCSLVVLHKIFNQLVLVVILLNSLLIAVAHWRPEIKFYHSHLMYPLDIIFTTLFTIEMCLKLGALGFLMHPRAYLRSMWNILDFLIVLISIFSLTPVGSGANFTVLRTFRILRPLRTMARVKGLRMLLKSIFAALPQLMDNVVLIGFMQLIFAIVGVQLFRGAHHKRCYVTDVAGTPFELDAQYNTSLPMLVNSMDHGMNGLGCGGSIQCAGDDIWPLSEDQVECAVILEKFNQRPDRDPLSFDNTGLAIILVFKLFTGDDWPEDTFALQNAFGQQCFLYFFSTFVIGNLFAMNLFLAVLIEQYLRAKLRGEWDVGSLVEHANHGLGTIVGVDDRVRVDFRRGTHKTYPLDTGKLMSWKDGVPRSSDAMPIESDAPPLAAAAELVDGGGSAAVEAMPRGGVDILNVTSPQQPDGDSKDVMGSPALKLAAVKRVASPHMHGVSKSPPPEMNQVLAVIPSSSPRPRMVLAKPTGHTTTAGGSPVRGAQAEAPTGIAALRQKAAHLVMHPAFDGFVMCVTFANVVSLAIDHHKMDKTLEAVLKVVNETCTWIYILEIVMKISGLGFLGTFTKRDERTGRFLGLNGFPCFDATLILISVPDMITGSASKFTAFRALRAMRMLKRFPSLQRLVAVIAQSLGEAGYVVLLLGLQIFIFAVLGMQLFEDKRAFDHERGNFNTLWEAAITCFVVITGDGWAWVMKIGMLARNEIAVPSLYFLSLHVIGNFIIINICIAVILGGLGDDGGDDVQQDGEAEAGSPDAAAPADASAAVNPLDSRRDSAANNDNKLLDAPPSESIGLRERAVMIVQHPTFDGCVLCLLMLNTLFLAIDYPKASEGLRAVLEVGDIIFTIVFTIEMVMKIAALGLWAPWGGASASVGGAAPEGYLRDKWNCVDGFVVITGLIALGVPALKVTRSLRTIRLIIKVKGIRVLVEALIQSMPEVTQGLALVGFLFLIFAIFGVQLFKGTFYGCNNANVKYEEQCVGVKCHEHWSQWRDGEHCMFNMSVPSALGEKTVPTKSEWDHVISDHFDNLWRALITLFQVALGENWSTVMYTTMNIQGVGRSPALNASPWYASFCILFHIVGSFFALNLVIGILIDTFIKERATIVAQGMLQIPTKTRLRLKSYLTGERAMRRQVFSWKPQAPESPPFRRITFRIIHHNCFEHIITFFIAFNGCAFASVHYNQKPGFNEVLEMLNYIFTAVFFVEAVMKLCGLGMQYFRWNWNRFDFTIVTLSILGLFIPAMRGISAVRVLRLARLFRLIARAKGLKKLFNVIFQIDNMIFFGNVGVFLVALYFIFACVGVSLFGKLKRTAGIDHNRNFENVGRAMQTLFWTATGEGWPDVRDGLTNTKECGRPEDGEYGECGKKAYILYVLAFMVIGSLIMMNVFAAVVCELLGDQGAEESSEQALAALYEFRDRWQVRFGAVRAVPCHEFINGMRTSEAEGSQSVESGWDDMATLQSGQGPRSLVPALLRRSAEDKRIRARLLRATSHWRRFAGVTSPGKNQPQQQQAQRNNKEESSDSDGVEDTGAEVSDADEDEDTSPQISDMLKLPHDRVSTIDLISWLQHVRVAIHSRRGCFSNRDLKEVRFRDVVYTLSRQMLGYTPSSSGGRPMAGLRSGDTAQIEALGLTRSKDTPEPLAEDYTLMHWYAAQRLSRAWRYRPHGGRVPADDPDASPTFGQEIGEREPLSPPTGAGQEVHPAPVHSSPPAPAGSGATALMVGDSVPKSRITEPARAAGCTPPNGGAGGSCGAEPAAGLP